MTLQVHPRSLILAPIEQSAYMTSYSTSIVILVLSCCIWEILQLLYAEPIFRTPLLFRRKFRSVPLGIDPWRLGCKERNPRLTDREIIFAEFQPMWSQSTTSQTDRQTTCDRKTALCTKVHRAVKTNWTWLTENRNHNHVGGNAELAGLLKVIAIDCVCQSWIKKLLTYSSESAGGCLFVT